MTAIQEPNKVADLIRNDAPAADARNALGLGSIATHDKGEFEPAGSASSITAEQLGVYTISQVDILLSERQPIDGDLAAIAAISGTGFARRTGPDTWMVGALESGDIPDLSATYSVVGHTHAGLSTAIAPGSLWGGQGSGEPAAVAIGSGLSLSGNTLAVNGGGGGGLTVGEPVSGGGANRVLLEDDSGNLAADPGLTYDGSTLTVGGAYPATRDLTVRHGNAGGLILRNIDMGTSARLMAYAGNTVYFPDGSITVSGVISSSNGASITAASSYWNFANQLWCSWTGSPIDTPNQDGFVAAPGTPGTFYRPFAAYTSSWGSLPGWYIDRSCDLRFGRFTSMQGRPSSAITSALLISTDATYTSRMTLKVSDYGGEREGLQVESNGSTADVIIPLANVRDAANDAAAAALSPAVPVGGIYRNGSQLNIRVT